MLRNMDHLLTPQNALTIITAYKWFLVMTARNSESGYELVVPPHPKHICLGRGVFLSCAYLRFAKTKFDSEGKDDSA